MATKKTAWISSLVVGLLATLSGYAQGLDDCQRCRHCVEGRYVPNRENFGYYQPSWRRWPVETASVVPPRQGKAKFDASLGPAVEVPVPESEADVAPEFPHLRQRASSTPAMTPKKTPAAQPSEETESTLPPATDLPKDDADPFSDDQGLLPDLSPNAPEPVSEQSRLDAGRTMRLGLGWVVEETAAQPASYAEPIPKSTSTSLAGQPASFRKSAGEEYPETGAGNPLRPTDLVKPRNSLRNVPSESNARASAAPPMLPIPTVANPLRGAGM